MTILVNDEEVFEGTGWECIDYATREYNLTDSQCDELSDGSVQVGDIEISLS